MDWKDTDVLKDWMRDDPVLWMEDRPLPQVPDVSDAVFQAIWGRGKAMRLKTWAHDPIGVHYLASRSGTPMHRDPKYKRYTHHLTLRNDGFYLHGVGTDFEHYPLLKAGTMLCLDTHSPHKVSYDPRLEDTMVNTLGVKIVLALDSDEPLTPDEVYPMLITRLGDTSPINNPYFQLEA